MNMMFKLDTPECMPTRAHQWDAGADLRATTSCSIPPGAMRMVDTGVAVKIPVGYVGLVFSRSSMGKVSVTLANSVGVIDESYRGNIKVMIKNHSPDMYYEITAGDRICQLVIMPVEIPDILVYSGNAEDWNDTARGEQGFGSSGKN